MLDNCKNNSKHNDMWVECGYDIPDKAYFSRNHWMYPDKVNIWRFDQHNFGIYVSAFQYSDKDDLDNSLLYGDFYLDFDKDLQGEDPESAFNAVRNDALTAMKYIENILRIKPSELVIFFSGGKGIHLLVSAESLSISPIQDLNRLYKMLADDIAKYCKNDTLDTKIYDRRRLFRIYSSRHAKSGLYKIQLSFDEFSKLSLAEIKELAKTPRPIQIPAVKPCPYACSYILNFRKKLDEERAKRARLAENLAPLTTTPPCINHILTNTVPQGQRNNTAVALCSFFRQQGVDDFEATQRLIGWTNQRCTPPIDEQEIDLIVSSIYTKPYKFGCGKLRELAPCDPDKCDLVRGH